MQKQKMDNSNIAVSLFAGCGGSSLGYHQAGFEIPLAVEWDKKAAEIYKDNFPTTDIFSGDIAKLSAEEALQRAGLQEGDLDLLDGSPPCQGFSMAGDRQRTDKRNLLFFEFLRMIQTFAPKTFVMENVTGLIRGKMKMSFAEITIALKAMGYSVTCKKLNSWWYGVPQSRERLIWIGIREDLKFSPSHPLPTTLIPNTVHDVLPYIWKIHSSFRSSVKKATLSNDWKSTAGPSPTLLATMPPFVVERGSQEVRKLTVFEAKLLQGFPENFAIEVYKPIGNSVPPPLTKAIGEHLKAELVTEA
jgi:DNA (cytosine-5)-methyltransferase 1|tara:strand:+ start:2055 stop:2963 length:909 start_codon:yes stop_codon:yes gene_type:complete